MPGVANRSGAGPQRDNLDGARYVRATFADGSKAITNDVFLEKKQTRNVKGDIREAENDGLDWASDLHKKGCNSQM